MRLLLRLVLLYLHNNAIEFITFSHCYLQAVLGKSGKKICCSCPDTKLKRDECITQNGEEKCKDLIELHKECLRAEGFTVK